MIDAERTGEKLKQIMKENSYTVIRLAKEMNIHQNAIYKWYQGRNLPNIDNLCCLADLYGVTIDELIVRRDT